MKIGVNVKVNKEFRCQIWTKDHTSLDFKFGGCQRSNDNILIWLKDGSDYKVT